MVLAPAALFCTDLLLKLTMKEEYIMIQPSYAQKDFHRHKQHKGSIEQSISLLGCDDMKKIQIVRKITEGKQKIIYKVLLPSGDVALAKRCKTKYCIFKRLLENESTYLSSLQTQYGTSESIRFYGSCDHEYPEETMMKNRSKSKNLQKYMKDLIPPSIYADFTQGYTFFVEFGKPLMPPEEDDIKFSLPRYIRCFSSYYTPADLEGFRKIARQYAGFEEVTKENNGSKSTTPVMLGDPKHFTDNTRPQNYILSKAGIRHADHDMLYKCKNCTYNEALKYNCKLIGRVLRLRDQEAKEWDCSVEYSQNHIVLNPYAHMNSTKANDECTKLIYRENRLQENKKIR